MNFNKDTFVKILHLFLRSILWKTSLKHALNKFLWFLKGIYCCMSQNSQLTHWQTENFIACQYPWQFFVCTESLCFNQKVVPHILSSSFLKEWLYLDTKLNVVLRQQYTIILAVLGVRSHNGSLPVTRVYFLPRSHQYNVVLLSKIAFSLYNRDLNPL